jgi:oligogalacturonide lyase
MNDSLVQGEYAGATLPSEMEEYEDPNTGARVRQLTNYSGVDDRPLYFKTNGWYDDGDRLLLLLRRPTDRHLFSLDLRDGVLTQLTDLPGTFGSFTGVNEARRELYFAYQHENELDDGGLFAVYGLNLDDLSVRRVFTPPERLQSHLLHVGGTTADGNHLLVWFQEPFGPHASDFESRHGSFPHCTIGAVPVDGTGGFEVLHEEDYWITHVEPSPTDPEVAIFCHEGRATDVDHRMWGVDVSSKQVWKIGHSEDDECVTREYWLQNGEDVGYFGWRKDGNAKNPVHGLVRYDDSNCTETELPADARTPHATTRSRFICRGGPPTERRLLVSEYDEGIEEYRGPRELATHSWDRRNQPRPHARFSPDGSTVLFNADLENDESNVYLVDVPDDLGQLPEH